MVATATFFPRRWWAILRVITVVMVVMVVSVVMVVMVVAVAVTICEVDRGFEQALQERPDPLSQ